MTSIFSKAKDANLPSAFRGLKERELTSLYNAATIRKVNAHEYLFREGDVDTSIWFILDGSVLVEKGRNGQPESMVLLPQGSSVEEVVFKMDKRRTASAMAVEPSTIMALSEQSLESLSSEIRLLIYQNLNELVTGRISDLLQKETELRNKNTHLISYIRDDLEKRNDDYSRSEIVQKVLKSFPRLPMYASKLAARLLDEEVSATEVVNLAKLDPSLVGMILKTVNSAYYGLQRKISNFQQAVLLLGFNQIYQLVMAHGIRSIMPSTPEFQELQFHSVVVSTIGFEISQLCGMKEIALHSTIGLMHDIGKSIVLLLKEQHPHLGMIVDTLRYGRIGSLLLREWNIPEEVCLTLEYQCYPEFCPPTEIPEDCRLSVALLHLAHLCHGYLQGMTESHPSSPFQDEYKQLLNVPERSVKALIERHLLPSMRKKGKTLPENVRRFLVEAENRLLEAKTPESEELPIVWNI